MMRPVLFAVALATGVPAAAQDVTVINARLVIGDGSAPIEGGTVVVSGGRVVSAGKGIVPPANIAVVDAKGRWVSPGLVEAFSPLAVSDLGTEPTTDDASASDARFSAALDLSDAVNPATMRIGVVRAAGITRALVSPEPGKSIFVGQGFVLSLGEGTAMPVTRPRAFQMVELGAEGTDLAGGSRSAVYAELRNAFADAADYRANPDGYGADRHVLNRADAAALVPVIEGRQILLAHADRASDLRKIVQLKRDYPRLRVTVTGAEEGWIVAREIAAAGVPVFASPNSLPDSFDMLAATASNIGRMKAAGVTVAISSGGMMQTRMTQNAGNLVALERVPGATGLDWNAAFAAITSGPATAIGMDDEIGTLRAGRRGDVVIWDGDPLDVTSAPVAIWIDGIAQPMRNRQTELRDRYAARVGE